MLQYIEQFKPTVSIFNVSAPTIQRDCPSMAERLSYEIAHCGTDSGKISGECYNSCKQQWLGAPGGWWADGVCVTGVGAHLDRVVGDIQHLERGRGPLLRHGGELVPPEHEARERRRVEEVRGHRASHAAVHHLHTLQHERVGARLEGVVLRASGADDPHAGCLLYTSDAADE